jgi:erythromycin esterase-like protein
LITSRTPLLQYPSINSPNQLSSAIKAGGMPPPMARTSLATELRHAVLPLQGSPQDYDPLLEIVGGASVVLLGEASHGTREFYAERDRIKTLEALLAHLDHERGRSRVVVWEHNSHVGDARATRMGAGGEWNVGQLSRERFGDDAVLVGFHDLRRNGHRGHRLGRSG